MERAGEFDTKAHLGERGGVADADGGADGGAELATPMPVAIPNRIVARSKRD